MKTPFLRPTDSSDGSATRVCALCGKAETIPLPNVFAAYTVDGLTVYGVDEHTRTAAFRKTLASGDFGVVVTESRENIVGTGTTVTVNYAPTLALTYTVVLRGDVDGDGDLTDVAILTRFLAGGWGVRIAECP